MAPPYKTVGKGAEIMSIKIGIAGYGNLGRGVECAIKQNPDMELAAVFTRRNPESVQILTEGVPVCRMEDAGEWKDRIDVMILCGGSATDLPEQTPAFAKMFNVIDSFDTHAKYRSTTQMSMQRQKKAVKWELSPWAGIRECSP